MILALLVCAPLHAAAQIRAFTFLAFDPGFGAVSTYNAYNGAVLGTLPVINSMAVAASPDGRRAYVTSTTGRVYVIDVATQTIIGPPIAVGALPVGIAVTPDGSRAFVANLISSTISVIDTATNTVISTLPSGNSPRDIAITPDGSQAVITNQTASNATLTVIDIATNTVTRIIPVGNSPAHISLTPDGHKAYVTLQTANKVEVLNFQTGQQVALIDVGVQPVDVKVSPDGALAFVTNFTSGTVSVIDVQNDTVVNTIGGLSQAINVGFTPDSAFAWVAGNLANAVYVIDVAARSRSAIIPLGGSASFLDIGPQIIGSTPLAIAGDAGLAAKGFTRFVPFLGGTLSLTSDLTTSRTISILSDNNTQTASTIVTNAFNATLTGDVIGEGTLIKRGTGTLALTGTSTNAGGIDIAEGTLAGTGTIAQLQTRAATTISPGINGPGVLHAGDLTFALGTTFLAQINGPSAGTGYDQLAVSGTAVLNNALLALNVGFTPAPGSTFTLVTHASGTFAGLAEGALLDAGGGRFFRITYHGGAGSDVVLRYDSAATLGPLSDQTIAPNGTLTVPLTIADDLTPAASLLITAASSNPALLPDANIAISGGSAGARTLNLTPLANASGQTAITVTVFDGAQTTTRSFVLTVLPVRSYFLAEGSTGGFFSTDILLANPNPTPAPIVITFFKDDGTNVVRAMTLPATSRTTLAVKNVDGMGAAAFSTSVVSTNALPLVVERTMWWDAASNYGGATEKASEQTATQWYFAEGSQGFFHTFFLLLNPNATDTIAHVTYLMEDGPAVLRDYPVPARSRLTVDAGSVPELINRSFGAQILFDQPGMAERAMYFGMNPLFSGGSAATGVTTPATDWFLAEGATGSFFDTFVLIANPGNVDATLTVTYLPASGVPVTRTKPLAAHQRLTINIATEDPSLASAAVSTRVTSDRPVIVERSQYWPHGAWYESHSSAGETATGLKWGVAEGRAGGANAAQTFILIANPGSAAADITATFLRTDGTTLVKHFTVDPTSRFNIAITGDGGGSVPELTNEAFGTIIESTRPVIVEHSLYANANGVIWAAGTNATATRLP